MGLVHHRPFLGQQVLLGDAAARGERVPGPGIGLGVDLEERLEPEVAFERAVGEVGEDDVGPPLAQRFEQVLEEALGHDDPGAARVAAAGEAGDHPVDHMVGEHGGDADDELPPRAGGDRFHLGAGARCLVQDDGRVGVECLAGGGRHHAARAPLEQGAPRSSSSVRIERVSAGWLMNTRSAARERLPASTTATKWRRCRSSMLRVYGNCGGRQLAPGRFAARLCAMAPSPLFDDPRFDPGFGAEINGPGPAYYPDPVFDNLLETMLALAAELWGVKDRLHHLEAALAEEGMEVAGRIEARAAALAGPERRAACDAYVAGLFGAFLRRTGAPPLPAERAEPLESGASAQRAGEDGKGEEARA